MQALERLLGEIRACEVCREQLPLGPRPIVSAHAASRVLIVGQAPGRRVHESGVAWNDPSGDRLREWLGVTRDEFYDTRRFALVPMGFCYPGTGKSGDLPPRPECSELWHERVIAKLPDVKLTILLSAYAHKFFLGDRRRKNVTETVRAWKEYRPRILPLPHPSPRNNRWLRNNPWLEAEVIPYLRRRVRALREG